MKFWKWWKKIPAINRFQIQLIIVFGLIGGFAFLLAPVWQEYNMEKAHISRLRDRTSKRAAMRAVEKLSTATPKSLKKQIREAERELAELRGDANELDTGFLPVDSAETRQQLMLELSKLAERSEVRLLRVSRKGFHIDKKGNPVVPLDTELQRPILQVAAQGDFDQLLAFLDGLSELSFYVSAVRVSLYALVPKGGARDGTININLELCI